MRRPRTGRRLSTRTMSRSISSSRIVEVPGRRDDPVAQREDRRDRLHGTGGAEQVARHRLGAGDRDMVGGRAQREPQRAGLGDVTDGGRGCVGVDVAYVSSDRLPEAERLADRARRSGTGPAPEPRRGRRPPTCLRPPARRTPEHRGPGMFLGLEHHDAGALAEDEAVAALVERAGRRLRLVIPRRQCTHLGEAGDRQRRDRRLRSAATTTSARPSRRMSSAYAMASAPDAQALTGACTPAFAFSSSPTVAAGPLGISIGTTSGETRRGPRSRRMSYWPMRVSTPPMPEPTTTASRSSSTSGRPASAQASRAATRANCWTRSSVRASNRSSGGSTATRAASRVGRSPAQSSVSRPTPDRPSSRPCQVVGASPPSGVVAPSPVTTTLMRRPRLAGCTRRRHRPS